MHGYRKQLRSGLVMIAIGGLMAAGLAVGATGTTTTSSEATTTGATTAHHTRAHSRMMHRGARHTVVSEVGDQKFRTVLVGPEIEVFLLDKSGKQTESIGNATGTATLTFSDGSTKDVTLTKATGPGPEHLAGTWEAAGGVWPTKADVNLSGLPGTTTTATYTAAFPQMRSRMHAAGSTSSGSSSSSSNAKSSDSGNNSDNSGGASSSGSPSGGTNNESGSSGK